MHNSSSNSAKKYKKSLFWLSLSKWKDSNQIWIKKSPDNLGFKPPQTVPLFEIVISKAGTFIINRHKRIFSVFEDQIICFKTPEDKIAHKIHAIIKYDDQLLIHWLYGKPKKQGKGENNAQKVINGFQLLKGTCFLRFQCSDVKALFQLKDLLKQKIKSTNFNEEYSLSKVIGRGAFSSVYLAKNINTKELFAVKAFNKRRYYSIQNGKDSVTNEILCMRKTSSHRNIIKLYEVFETYSFIYLVMELISGGNLQDHLMHKKSFPQAEIRSIMRGIFAGIAHIHSRKVMHRDIKPNNILMRSSQTNEDDNVCIADFGLATPIDLQGSYLFYRCGTPGFAAPEIINNTDPSKKYHAVCDVFSAGCVFYHLLTGKPLFKKKYESILVLNQKCEVNFNGKALSMVPDLAKNLLKRTLEKNPENRISAKEALEHPYLSLNKLTKLDSENFLFIPDEIYDQSPQNSILNGHFFNKKRNEDFFEKTPKSQNLSMNLSKRALEDLITNTPVLNGYLNTVEFGESGLIKSHHSIFRTINRDNRVIKNSVSKSLPRIDKNIRSERIGN